MQVDADDPPREMAEALIVNPYHVEDTADAMDRAIRMPAAEQRERMASLHSTMREFNVCRWAGLMLSDAGRWRLRARQASPSWSTGEACTPSTLTERWRRSANVPMRSASRRSSHQAQIGTAVDCILQTMSAQRQF